MSQTVFDTVPFVDKSGGEATGKVLLVVPEEVDGKSFGLQDTTV